MATLQPIQMKIKNLRAQADALIAKRASAVIADIRKLMAEHGLTTADIETHTGTAKGGTKRGPKPGAELAGKVTGATSKKPIASAKGKLPPKYRDPKTAATWSGHARPPAWIANVKDRTKFLIGGVSAAVSGPKTASKPKAAAKSAGKSGAKGKLPPKYINPKTGETWSGHARPPAWIKDVKDRSKFLIDRARAATDAVAASKASTTKKAIANKVAIKKVAVKKSAAKKATAGTKKPVSANTEAKQVSAKQAAPAAAKQAPD